MSCFSTTSCSGAVEAGTVEECCKHGVAPFGLSYQLPGVEECQLCPVGKFVMQVLSPSCVGLVVQLM